MYKYKDLFMVVLNCMSLKLTSWMFLKLTSWKICMI